MAIVINGSGTLSGLAVGGLPDGTVDSDTIATGTIVDADVANVAASKLTGALPAISAASLTNVPKDVTVGGRKNILKNGGFDVWQRGTSFSHTSGKNFICDRWWVNPSSVGGTQTRQSAGLDGFNYALRMQRTSGQSGTGLVYLNTEMESADSMQFRGKKVTLSFYARKGANFSQSSSQLTSNLATGTGTDQTLQTGFTGGANVISQNNTLTTSWQRFSHTTSSVLASTVNQIAVQFTHSPAGTAGAADYYEITGVQLEVGDTATDFEHRSYGEELALCHRYYQRTARYTTFAGFSNGGSNTQFGVPLTVPLRNTPTVTIENASGTNSWSARHNGGENGNASTCNVEKWEADCTTVHLQMGSFGSNSDMYVNNLYSGNRSIQMDSEL